jgi:alanine racemase
LKSKNRIEVSKSALLHNFDLLKEKSGLDIIPVIKSDGYGHGVGLVASVLRERKPPYVAVNDIREAKEVQKAAPDQAVLVLGAVDVDEFHRGAQRTRSTD